MKILLSQCLLNIFDFSCRRFLSFVFFYKLTVQLCLTQSSQKRLAENFLLITTVIPKSKHWPTPMMVPGDVFTRMNTHFKYKHTHKEREKDKSHLTVCVSTWADSGLDICQCTEGRRTVDCDAKIDLSQWNFIISTNGCLNIKAEPGRFWFQSVFFYSGYYLNCQRTLVVCKHPCSEQNRQNSSSESRFQSHNRLTRIYLLLGFFLYVHSHANMFIEISWNVVFMSNQTVNAHNDTDENSCCSVIKYDYDNYLNIIVNKDCGSTLMTMILKLKLLKNNIMEREVNLWVDKQNYISLQLVHLILSL